MERSEIARLLRENRPNLKETSIRSYTSVLNTLCRVLDIKSYQELQSSRVNEVIEHINSLPKPQSRRSLYSALFVMTHTPVYRVHMLENADEVKKLYAEHKQDDRTMPREAVAKIHADTIAKWKQNPSLHNFTDAIIVSVFSGADELPPRRLADYTNLKLKNVGATDNFYDARRKEFVFRQYKTASTYGEQRVAIPKSLQSIVTKYIKTFPENEFLLTTDSGRPFSSSSLSQRVSKIFNGMTLDLLRASYVTSKVDVGQMERMAEQMGTSPGQITQVYAKRT
jgi:hypothetical protein